MNAIASRKQRQRLARETLILEHAARLLGRDGFQDLNLDELAQAVEYSKGTLYLHFKTKEDLVLAVSTQALLRRADLLERATAFKGTTRERARAMGFACCEFMVENRDFFSVELMLQARSFWNRVSPERQALHMAQAARVFNLLRQLASEARACGDLPASCSPEEVTLSMMALTMGSHCAITQPRYHSLVEVCDPLAVLLMHQDRMLDGWKWRPLSNGSLHAALDRRIYKEVFPQSSWFKP